jgi:hypothetical protein
MQLKAQRTHPSGSQAGLSFAIRTKSCLQPEANRLAGAACGPPMRCGLPREPWATEATHGSSPGQAPRLLPRDARARNRAAVGHPRAPSRRESRGPSWPGLGRGPVSFLRTTQLPPLYLGFGCGKAPEKERERTEKRRGVESEIVMGNRVILLSRLLPLPSELNGMV